MRKALLSVRSCRASVGRPTATAKTLSLTQGLMRVCSGMQYEYGTKTKMTMLPYDIHTKHKRLAEVFGQQGVYPGYTLANHSTLVPCSYRTPLVSYQSRTLQPLPKQALGLACQMAGEGLASSSHHPRRRGQRTILGLPTNNNQQLPIITAPSQRQNAATVEGTLHRRMPVKAKYAS